MARCGCSGLACSCLIEAGANITVTGSGSAGSPYVIASLGNSTTVADTATINASITGTGTTGDPYVVFGSVKLDPGVTNLLAATANGLFLDCAAIAACPGIGGGVVTVADTSTVDLTLTGTGTLGDPYVVSAAVKLSLTAGNLLTADGTGVFLSCDDIRTCLVEGDGINYDPLTGEISAFLSTDPGNSIGFGTDGGLYVFPEKFFVQETLQLVEGSGQTNTFGAVVAGGPTDVGGPTSILFTNPSAFYDMLVVMETGVEHALLQFGAPGPNDVSIGARYTVTGGITDAATQAGHQRWGSNGTVELTFDSTRSGVRKSYLLAPGDSATFTLYSSMDLFAYTASALLTDWSNYMDIVGYSV